MIASKSSFRSKTRKSSTPRPAASRATKPAPERPRTAKTKGLKFEPHFHTQTGTPFDHVEWDQRTAEINDDSGKVIFKQEKVEVPRSWSALATKIAVSKYFYGDLANGTDPHKSGRESSIRQLIHRVTRTITDFGIADGYFADDDSAEAFYQDLTWLCLHQHGAFNSPVWFNVGLHQQYGVGKDAGQGNYFFNHLTGEADRAPTQYQYPQASACFIQSVGDNMESILDLAKSEAMLFKYGSGTGSDLSTIRSTREKLSGGGRPSGPLSFLKVYDQVASVVKSGGKTRRAAKMNTLKDWHPDIEEFIEAKMKEERKAWALIEQGYDGSFNGEAYGSVMYQNENLTVRVTDEFMEAALAGSITSIMSGHAYEQSARIAAHTGPFPGYRDSSASGVEKTIAPDNVEPMLHVMQLHRDAVEKIEKAGEFEFLRNEARQVWDEALHLGKKHGYRNAQVTVLAPTGTIGFLMDCDTTGIEPDIALVKYKLLAGGGMLKIVNQTVRPALHKLGYSPADIEAIIAHIDKYDTIEDAEEEGRTIRSGLRAEHVSVFDCAFKPMRGERSLNYHAHIRMMAAAQPFLSGAISKTVNLPEHATVEDIIDTYVEGWKLGLKAIAIYRDGSKRSAPVVTDKKKHGTGNGELGAELSTKNELEERVIELQDEIENMRVKLNQPPRNRLPDTRVALNHKFDIAGHEGYITVGLFENGQPGELFIQMAKEGSTIGGLMDTVATLTSISLQYGVPLESLVKKFAFQRFEPSGFTKNPDIRNASSITDYVFRWLGCQFIKGYKEATAPNRNQPELPMKEIPEMERRAVNRPVSDLPRTGEREIIDVITQTQNSEGTPFHISGTATHAERIQGALGTMFMDTTCSHCGSNKVIRAGACGVCTECGTSQGCS